MRASNGNPKFGRVRNKRTALRLLSAAIREESDDIVKRRLIAVAELVREPIPRNEIKRRIGVAPSTAYGYLCRFEKLGVDGLRTIRSVGRPAGIPAFARTRFQLLVDVDPITGEKSVIYVPDHERRVLMQMTGKNYSLRQIGRWFHRFVEEGDLRPYLRRFRETEKAWAFLEGRTPPLFSWCWESDPARAQMLRRRRIHALKYQTRLFLADEEMLRWHIAACADVEISAVQTGEAEKPTDLEIDAIWDQFAAPTHLPFEENSSFPPRRSPPRHAPSRWRTPRFRRRGN